MSNPSRLSELTTETLLVKVESHHLCAVYGWYPVAPILDSLTGESDQRGQNCAFLQSLGLCQRTYTRSFHSPQGAWIPTTDCYSCDILVFWIIAICNMPLFKPEPIPPWLALSSPTALHITHWPIEISEINMTNRINNNMCLFLFI